MQVLRCLSFDTVYQTIFIGWRKMENLWSFHHVKFILMNLYSKYCIIILKKYINRSVRLIWYCMYSLFIIFTNISKYRKYMKSMVKISENNKVSIHFSTRIMLLLGVHILMHMYVDVRYYFYYYTWKSSSMNSQF